jgi:hypothetical protein
MATAGKQNKNKINHQLREEGRREQNKFALASKRAQEKENEREREANTHRVDRCSSQFSRSYKRH